MPRLSGCACATAEECEGGAWCHEGACKLPVCGDEIEDPDEECEQGWTFESCTCTQACEVECTPKDCLPD